MLVLDWPGRNCGIHSLPDLLAQVKEGEKGNTKIFGHYVILNPYAILLLGYFYRGDTESSRRICKENADSIAEFDFTCIFIQRFAISCLK